MHPPIDSGELDAALERAANLVRKSARVAVLTGAGVSAESGVPTFRDSDGLWENHRVEDVATPDAFRRDPGLVWRFYNARRAALRKVAPNPGHHALARLEERLGAGNFTLITQNVDGLHRAAGSKNVLEVHGNLRLVRCSNPDCEGRADHGLEDLPALPTCVACGQLLRPDIVWFGEALPPDVWARAERAVKECQCFLTIGTSAVVWPAAGLVLLANDHDAHVIEVNLKPTDATRHVHVHLTGPSGQLLPRLLELVEKGEGR
jgi:NAD-dependent deacetylase